MGLWRCARPRVVRHCGQRPATMQGGVLVLIVTLGKSETYKETMKEKSTSGVLVLVSVLVV